MQSLLAEVHPSLFRGDRACEFVFQNIFLISFVDQIQ